MNIEQANSISLPEILEKITASEGKRVGRELVFHSPFRNERTPSFHVNTDKNLWFDFGEGIGGNVVTFVCTYLKISGEAYTPADALRWIRNMTGQYPKIAAIKEADIPIKADKKLSLVRVGRIEHQALKDYLNLRGIPFRLANRYLKEACLYNKETRKHFHALALENENGGFELRNPYLKISIKKKGLTFVRGTVPKPDAIHFFEGAMDFLSVLADRKMDRLTDDAIILNSLSMLQSATPLIQNYGYRKAYSWMDNDPAGDKATNAIKEFCKTESGLQHIPMNGTYHPHKDVNQWHMHRLTLS